MSLTLAAFLILFASLASSQVSQNVYLKADGEEKLWPTTLDEGFHETKWSITSCPGCKTLLSCVILSKDCNEHILTIFNGEEVTKHCGPEERYVSKSSVSEMTVTIHTVGPRKGSYCKATATRPYLNDVFVKRDSAEDGQKEGKKATSCKCGWTNKPSKRIVGGNEASPHEYPFAVLLGIRRTDYKYCGGSIISPYHVLTAAHCTYPMLGIALSVYIGEHDVTLSSNSSEKIDVQKVFDHPEYDDRTNVNDIAVAKLVSKIAFTKLVGPVCLPSFKQDLLNDYIKVVGWGHIRTKGPSSPTLRKVDLKVIDLNVCKSIYRSIELLKPSQICTWSPERDSCQGDSGGPLVWLDPSTNRYTQVAVVSYGKDCASTDPGVNSDVNYYLDWISSIIKKTSTENLCV